LLALLLSHDISYAAAGDADDDGIADRVECAPALAAAEDCPDTDDDGRPDYLDSDSDGDHVADAVDGINDSDEDGKPNYLDADDDNDGIPTSWELHSDADNDGLLNYLDSDSDNDGLPDGKEGTGDVDGDGLANYLDEDSDGDGITDAAEGVADSDQDGIEDYVDAVQKIMAAKPQEALLEEAQPDAGRPQESTRDNEPASSKPSLAAVSTAPSAAAALSEACRRDDDCASGKCEKSRCVCDSDSDCPTAPGGANAAPFCIKAIFRANQCILRCETDADCPAETPRCAVKLGTAHRRCYPGQPH
jgi:hypothetical protein